MHESDFVNKPSIDKNVQSVMAFDYGLRNVGVAMGNCALNTSQGIGVIKARGGVPNWDNIASLLKEWQPDLVVVGLPLNMDGTESEMSRRATKFSRQLEGRFGVKVALIDERLSSREAKLQAREAGHRGDYNSDPIDALAAEIILQDWLNTH